jgi:hypothetical protein
MTISHEISCEASVELNMDLMAPISLIPASRSDRLSIFFAYENAGPETIASSVCKQTWQADLVASFAVAHSLSTLSMCKYAAKNVMMSNKSAASRSL